jgi:TonB-dependent receptor
MSVPSFAAEKASEIVITGVRGSLRDSLIMKRKSDLVTENISTKDIGQLPDVTIAEELNRLPGVNTTRDRGNASQAALRGLGPRFVLGLVNGREVASSEPSQDVRWEVYPSEVLAGARVYKSQDVSIVPGGIAGTIDILTLQPLDYEGPEVSLRVGPTLNEAGKSLPHYDPWGGRGSVAFVRHLNDRFAVAVAGSYQREKNGFPMFRTFNWNTPSSTGANAAGIPVGPANPGHTGDLTGTAPCGTGVYPSPQGCIVEDTTYGLVEDVKEIQQDRFAVMGAAGWKANDNLTINFDTLYSAYTIGEDNFQTWYGNNFLGNWNNGNYGAYNAADASYTVVNGAVVAGHFPSAFPNYQTEIARYREKHWLAVYGLDFAWTWAQWDARLDLSHSNAWRNNKWAALLLDTEFTNPGLDFDIRDGQTPSATLLGGTDPAATAIQHATPSSSGFPGRDGIVDGPWHTGDRISAIATDFTRHIEDSFFTSFQFGARFSDRLKSHRHFAYGLCVGSLTPGTCDAAALANPGGISLAGMTEEFNNSNAFTAPPMVWGDWDTLFPLLYPAYASGIVPAGAERFAERSRVGERTDEFYAKFAFTSEILSAPITGSLGVRVAQVRTTSSGLQQVAPSPAWIPVSVSNKYTNWLPDFNATIHLTELQLLRIGAGISVSRPPLEALRTGFSLSDPALITPANPVGSGSGANPFIKAFKSTQIDLSYEYYFHDESLFSIAAYYKHLDSYIGSAPSFQVINGNPYNITTSTNIAGGDIAGLEFTYQTRFYFLPGFWSDFGTYMNYSFAETSIEEVQPSLNATTNPATIPYKMAGLVPQSGTFTLFYNRGPFEAYLSLKTHAAFPFSPGWDGSNVVTLEGESIVDASMAYQLTKNIGLRFQARNLNNETQRYTQGNNSQLLDGATGYSVFGRSYLFDISLKY